MYMFQKMMKNCSCLILIDLVIWFLGRKIGRLLYWILIRINLLLCIPIRGLLLWRLRLSIIVLLRLILRLGLERKFRFIFWNSFIGRWPNLNLLWLSRIYRHRKKLKRLRLFLTPTLIKIFGQILTIILTLIVIPILIQIPQHINSQLTFPIPLKTKILIPIPIPILTMLILIKITTMILLQNQPQPRIRIKIRMRNRKIILLIIILTLILILNLTKILKPIL